MKFQRLALMAVFATTTLSTTALSTTALAPKTLPVMRP